MPQQFEIPGLDASIKDMKALTVNVNELIKVLLKVSIEGEKALKPFQNVKTIKGYSDAIKVSEIQTKLYTKAQQDAIVVDTKLKIAEGELGKQIAASTAALKVKNQENKSTANINDQVEASLKKQIKTVNEANAQNALLRQAVKNTDTTTKEGQATIVSYNAVIDKNTAFVKNNADAFVKQKMEIGNYSGAIEGALQKSGLMTGKIGEMAQSAIGFVQVGANAVTKIKDINTSVVTGAKNIAGFTASKLGLTKATKEVAAAQQIETTSTKSNTAATETGKVAKIGFQQAEKIASATIKESVIVTQASSAANKEQTVTSEANAVAKVTMAGATEGAAVAEGTATVATNILNVSLGILLSPVTLVIAAFGLLIYIFKDFAPLINPIKDAFSALGAIFETVKQAIFDLVTGARSLKDIFSSLGGEMGKAATEAMNLAKAQREVAKAMDINEVAMAKAQTKVQQLILQSKDRSKTEKERIDLINQAQKVEEDAFKVTNDLNNKEIKNKRDKLFEGKKLSEQEIKFIENNDFAKIRSLKISKNLDTEMLESYKQTLIKKEALAQTHNQIMEKAQNRENQMADKADEKEQKAKDDAKKSADDAEKKREDISKKAIADGEKWRKNAEDNEKKSLEFTINAMKSALDFKIASYKQEENTLNSNLAFVQTISLAKQDIAKSEQKKALIGITENSLDSKNIVQASEDNIKKIKAEAQTASENIQNKNISFELELYDFRNKTLIEEGKDLTDILVEQEKNRLLEFQKVHLEALAKELNIDDEKLKQKIKNNEELSTNDLKYLQNKEKLEKQTADSLKKNDADLVKAKEKTLNDEQKNNNRIFNLGTKNAFARQKNALKEDDKALKEKLKLTKKGSQEEKDIEISLKENKVEMNNIVAQNKKDQLMAGLDAVINVAGAESNIGKAMAIAKTTMNTYEAASAILATASASPETILFPGYPQLMVGLTIASGLMQVSKIAGVKMFAEGTDDAPYTGKAIVDELGPEFHFDKSWNLKSKGSDGGARLTDIVKGDKIIPADISALLQYSMYTGGNIAGANPIDYDKIGAQFKKHTDNQTNRLAKELRLNRSAVSINVQKNITDRVTFRGRNV